MDLAVILAVSNTLLAVFIYFVVTLIWHDCDVCEIRSRTTIPELISRLRAEQVAPPPSPTTKRSVVVQP